MLFQWCVFTMWYCNLLFKEVNTLFIFSYIIFYMKMNSSNIKWSKHARSMIVESFCDAEVLPTIVDPNAYRCSERFCPDSCWCSKRIFPTATWFLLRYMKRKKHQSTTNLVPFMLLIIRDVAWKSPSLGSWPRTFSFYFKLSMGFFYGTFGSMRSHCFLI